MERGEGERLLAARRKRFWTIIGLLAAAGFIVGLFAGIYAGYTEAQAEAASTDGFNPADLPIALRVGAVAIAAALFAGLSIWFFREVDELELADNLWGSTAGFYAYSVLFPVWWALWKLAAAPEPNDWAIFAVALITGMLAYGWRKWRAR